MYIPVDLLVDLSLSGGGGGFFRTPAIALPQFSQGLPLALEYTSIAGIVLHCESVFGIVCVK